MQPLDLVPVDEAEAVVLSHPCDVGTEEVSLGCAEGRVLREDILCDRDLPPFDRVTMDGVAIATSAWTKGQRSFAVAFTQPAGQPERTLDDPGACVKVMTGAVLPVGTDCIIPREQVTLEGDQAMIADDAVVEPMKFVHQKGGDAKKGARALSAGIRIGSPQALIASSLGAARVTVARYPSVAVVSNGDELVPIDTTPAPHQIRNSNAYALQTGLQQEGVKEIELVHLPDDKDAMLEGVAGVLQRHDVAIFSGGVSAGDFDYLPQVMKELGVEKKFHKVAQRPGKPFWFGVSPDSKPVFALPGNPVSTLVCFHCYIRPWLRQSLGLLPPAPVFAILEEEITFTGPLSHFLQVVVAPGEDGSLQATPATHRGSGDYASLAGTDGFIQLPADRDHFPAGTPVRYFSWR